MERSARLLIGSPTGRHVLVEPTRWEFPDAEDYDDGNWIYADISVAGGAFRGRYEAQLRAEEFLAFREGVAALYDNINGAASFETMEEWLTVRIQGDGRGHFAATCEACDAPGLGARLKFDLEFDQTDIPAMVKGLEEIVRLFPVRGYRT